MDIQFGGQQHTLPAAAVVGVIGESGSGVGDLLRAAADSYGGRYCGPTDELVFDSKLLCLEYSFDLWDVFTRIWVEAEFERLRRSGATIILASHDEIWLRRLADEVWWVHEGKVRAQGDPGEVLTTYGTYVSQRVKSAMMASSMTPAMRRGDGRAEIIALETLDEAGQRTGSWPSGSTALVRVSVRFLEAVADPVVGIMIRTRVGMEVYGTNTELEGLRIGPCNADEVRVITFRFSCNLCAQHYTITAASHDPNGVWHDWLEDAVAFTVTDTRYTAGVANLRAEVTCSRG